MTPAEREKMNLLSMLIQHEGDHEKYVQYVKEIIELMSHKEQRLALAELSKHTKQSASEVRPTTG
jgi:hypothetical protein